MTNDKVHPCLKALDADCFRARPAWAKQAFAYRIVHLLTPKALTKRLPKGLRRGLLAPGVVMPPGLEMPPGVVVGPGGEIPAAWTPGDPLPPGAIAPGETPPGSGATGITPPTYVAPAEPGPVSPPGIHPAPAQVTTTIIGANPDGYLFIAGSWAYCKAATTAQSGNVTVANDQYAHCARDFFGTKYIYRSWYTFDLSSIPAGKTCVSAILTLGGYQNADSAVSIQEGTQGDYLLMSDLQAYAGSGFATATWQVSGAGGTKLNQFTFNAAGLAYLTTAFGGRAQFCGREYDHDCLNVSPAITAVYNNGVYYSESTDAALRPTLTISY